MFSGIVEEVGQVAAVRRLEDGRSIRIAARRVLERLAPGDSIAVDGVCLTVARIEPDGFAVDAIGTTLSRTTLAACAPDRRVNLERALALGDRVGGHLVQGHVDGTGEVAAIEHRGEYVLLDFSMPEPVAEVTVLHGSIALNGVSLTVNALPRAGVAQVALIPYTWAHTSLSDLAHGDAVNLEGDMMGKFVLHHLRRVAAAHQPGAAPSAPVTR